MFCSHCGEPNVAQSVRCSKCGSQLPPEYIRSKNPQLAVFLSFLATGLGQFYNGQYFKGFFLMIAYITLALASIMDITAIHLIRQSIAAGDSNTVLIGDLYDAVPFVPIWAWGLLNTVPWTYLFFGAPIVLIVLWIWGMADANDVAKLTNPTTTEKSTP